MPARELSMAEAINEAIRHEMRRNPNIVLLGQDIGAYGGTFGVYKGLFDEFGPQRVRDGPLSEAATTGVAIGLAMSGMPAIVEIDVRVAGKDLPIPTGKLQDAVFPNSADVENAVRIVME